MARLPLQIGDLARRLAGAAFGEDRDFVAASAAPGGAVVGAPPTSAYTLEAVVVSRVAAALPEIALRA
jgi:hypothetical protein